MDFSDSGSGGGNVDGLWPSDINDSLHNRGGRVLRRSITTFTNSFPRVDLFYYARDLLFSANLTNLTKRVEIISIDISNIFRRLTAKVACIVRYYSF